MYKYYRKGVSMMGRPSLKDLKEEFNELLEDQNVEELSDVLHTLCRLIRVPAAVSWVVARKTAMKHAKRVAIYGCPRSPRTVRQQVRTAAARKGLMPFARYRSRSSYIWQSSSTTKKGKER